MRKLKVYGWCHMRGGVDRRRLKGDAPHHDGGQCRAICAASSMAEVGRIMGHESRQLFNLTETGNDLEEQVALANPRVPYIASHNGGIRVVEDYLTLFQEDE